MTDPDRSALAAKVAAYLAESVPVGDDAAEARDFMAEVRVVMQDRFNLQLVTTVVPMGVESLLFEVPAHGDREVGAITIGLAMLQTLGGDEARRVLEYLMARYPREMEE